MAFISSSPSGSLGEYIRREAHSRGWVDRPDSPFWYDPCSNRWFEPRIVYGPATTTHPEIVWEERPATLSIPPPSPSYYAYPYPPLSGITGGITTGTTTSPLSTPLGGIPAPTEHAEGMTPSDWVALRTRLAELERLHADAIDALSWIISATGMGYDDRDEADECEAWNYCNYILNKLQAAKASEAQASPPEELSKLAKLLTAEREARLAADRATKAIEALKEEKARAEFKRSTK